MLELPIKEQIAIDLKPWGYKVESRAQEGLKPYPAGLYDRSSLYPVLTFGHDFWRRERPGSNHLVRQSVMSLADVQSDIFTVSGKLLVRHHYKNSLTEVPELPIHGIRMCLEVIHHIVKERSAWLKSGVAPMKTLWEEFLLEGYWGEVAGERTFIRPYAGNEAFITPIYEMLSPLIAQVQTFIGEDRWIMHFVKPRGTDAFIEKSIDYRIHDWMARMSSGEWA